MYGGQAAGTERGPHEGPRWQEPCRLLTFCLAYSSVTVRGGLPVTSDHGGGSSVAVSCRYSSTASRQVVASGCLWGTGMRTEIVAGPFQSFSMRRMDGSLHACLCLTKSDEKNCFAANQDELKRAYRAPHTALHDLNTGASVPFPAHAHVHASITKQPNRATH